MIDDSAITVPNLNKSFFDIHAVPGISFDVHQGEILSLPVAFVDQDEAVLGPHLLSLLGASDAVRPVVEKGSVDYLRAPSATVLVGVTMALWVAALGLLIGVLARTDKQLIIFAMVPLFVLSALREAWIPLEEQSETFQAIGHVLPSVWAMDGLKNIVIRDIGLSGALQPAGIVPAYAAALFALAVWRFGTE